MTMFLEDEAAQVSDDFYAAILPMLIVNNGQLVCMSTPFGKRGHFFNEWESSGATWKKIEITADKCPRITAEQLEQQKQSLGDMFFRQEFMCEFVETEDQSFSYDLIKRAFDENIEPLFGEGEIW